MKDSPKDPLSDSLKGIRLARAVSRGPLHLFPLVGGDSSEDELSLLEEALRDGSLLVDEHGRGGSVPELRVVNRGEVPVLILEGDELAGLKQDRVVNSSVLVAPLSALTLPVSCIEQGRWSRRSRPFSQGSSSSHLSLRRLKSRSVHESLRKGRGHRSDQGAVWDEVERLSDRHDSRSPTRALRDARTRLSEKLAEFEALAGGMPDDARGVVVALGGRPVALEVLAGPRSFAKVFPRLLAGYALEALEAGEDAGVPDPFSAGGLIEAAISARREDHPPVGAGRDVRLESDLVSGYALLDDERTIHAAVFAG
jgi:hypothetical protein